MNLTYGWKALKIDSKLSLVPPLLYKIPNNKAHILPELLSQFEPRNVFNADEINLFSKKMKEKH